MQTNKGETMNKQQAIKMWRDEIKSLEKQNKYCKQQINKKPAKWEIKEYKAVINTNKKKIL